MNFDVTLNTFGPIDFSALRAQKHGLVLLGESDPGLAWIQGVVNIIDVLQDALADRFGERLVYGTTDPDEADSIVAVCAQCAMPIARDTAGEEPTWVDVTCGDVCCGVEPNGAHTPKID